MRAAFCISINKLQFFDTLSTTNVTSNTPTITRHDRHAFQSLVWNLAASERIKLYGREGVVEGDLVFPKDSAAVLDDNDEPVLELVNTASEASADAKGEDADVGGEGEPEAKRAKTGGVPAVHVVTKEDVEQGTFLLTDVVLPMPG